MNRQSRFLPAALLALLLWIVASLPGSELNALQTMPQSTLVCVLLSDPVMHAVTMGGLVVLSSRLGRTPPGSPLRAGLWVTGYGFLIELYQGLLPWRTFGWDDLLWNLVGAAATILMLETSRALRNMLVSRKGSQRLNV